MKVLHTSDWHLGRALYSRKRYDEFKVFLDWLAELIKIEKVDILMVAGDVFDSNTPSNRAQELYYQFLCQVSASCCRHIIITAGNHDSPTFLNAPQQLLKVLNIYVVGSLSENPADEVITLYDTDNKPEAVVCAVPYLRDRDIRSVESGESMEDKNARLIEGIRQHYADVGAIAEQRQKEYGAIPIIGMGHLFTAGGKTVVDDGVRELYVGFLAHVSTDVFPACFDYVALGHLHVAQIAGKFPHIRYCGSPLPMGFGEADQIKKVIIVEFGNSTPEIKEFHVPCFQSLKRISGNIAEIIDNIKKLADKDSTAWLEIIYTGTSVAADLREQTDEAVADTGLEILRIKNARIMDQIINKLKDEETLDDLDVLEVFDRCLQAHDIMDEERPGLIQSYQEIINTLNEEEVNKE